MRSSGFNETNNCTQLLHDDPQTSTGNGFWSVIVEDANEKFKAIEAAKNCTRFKDNTAGIHSDTLSTYTSNIKVDWTNSSATVVNELVSINATGDGTNQTREVIFFPSGQAVNFTVTLFDDLG